MKRSDFVQAPWPGRCSRPRPSGGGDNNMIGIQVGAVSFVDEGVTKVLDVFQAAASINTLFTATFTYGRGIAGRQVPGQPLPDHGKQGYDADTLKGGSYTRIRPQDYRDTAIRDFRAPDFGDYDVKLANARGAGVAIRAFAG